jgi:transcription termination factor Rho
VSVLDRKELEQSPLADLHTIAAELGVEGYRRLRRDELIDTILGDSGGGDEAVEEARRERAAERPRRSRSRRPAAVSEEIEAESEVRDEERDEARPHEAPEEVRSGILDVLPNGSGFMRTDAFAQSRDDVYVSPAQIRRCELRAADEISGPVRSPRRSERHPSLVRVEMVNGAPAEPPADRKQFSDLTPVFPTERLSGPDGLDQVPFGKGSRVAVGGAPGAGVTTLLRSLVQALASAHPDLDTTVVLAGVRPEEVTEWRRDGGVKVAGGGFDRPVEEQAQSAEMAVERGKRVVERGGDAVVVIDGLDALPPGVARRVFGAARKAEEGGSLTVIASSGTAGEPQRVANTRIVLEPGGPGKPPSVAPGSSTLRADLLA